MSISHLRSGGGGKEKKIHASQNASKKIRQAETEDKNLAEEDLTFKVNVKDLLKKNTIKCCINDSKFPPENASKRLF